MGEQQCLEEALFLGRCVPGQAVYGEEGVGRETIREVSHTSHAASCGKCLPLHVLGFPSDREHAAALPGS